MFDFSGIYAHCRMGVVYRMSPVFFFALTLLSGPLDFTALAIIFVILHFLLYPSCHLYNDYCDKDETPIACMEKPVPVSDDLYWASLLMDSFSVVWSAIYLGQWFAVYSFLFAIGSRLYSGRTFRVKARPIGAVLLWNILEGYMGIMAIYMTCSDPKTASFWDVQAQMGAIIYTLALCGAWPIFQIYQHESDKKNNEVTLSRYLGVRGTMRYVFITMFLSVLLHLVYFYIYVAQPIRAGFVFLTMITPPLIYFLNWWVAVLQDRKNADFQRTMRFTFLSATSGLVFYTWLTATNVQTLQRF